jgi:serine protease AprX
MAIPIPSSLVEFILLGPLDDRRQLQDSPILGDVWVEFGRSLGKRRDLLIAPYRGEHAGSVAALIDNGLTVEDDQDGAADIAFLQGLIVASLTFKEMMQVVAPKTKWWTSRWRKDVDASSTGSSVEKHEVQDYNPDKVKDVIVKKILGPAKEWHTKSGQGRVQEVPPLERFLTLTALILWACETKAQPAPNVDDQISYVLNQAIADIDEIARLLHDLAAEMLKDRTRDPLVWQVSLNRPAMPALSRSVPAVKADAATTLFKVNCSEIGWAVIDSGIDSAHPAFLDEKGNSRVKRSFDFKNFRKIVSLSNSKEAIRRKNAAELMKGKDLLLDPPADEAEAMDDLKRLADDARKRGPVHWELVEKFVELKTNIPEAKPKTNHGTHVAGIIGASKLAAEKYVERSAEKRAAEKKAAAGEAENVAVEGGVAAEKAAERVAPKMNSDIADGMCPDISLYDFRVLGADIKDTEFAIIAALQYIRHLNSQDNFLKMHGANLSLSIPHDVRNFACGRTPICDECERLVASGVVVVAAAGNHGYKSFETKEGSYDSYAAFSITDPGNADSILTVGATHRFWPHTYGVSFFSSRGPTGDGRLKPDLVAPGERIKAPFTGDYDIGGAWGDLDGTSMAAPHVSGAAAMLMARYSELVGQPARIKRILCESATDLGRERNFQGHGMLDVLRAFQSI